MMRVHVSQWKISSLAERPICWITCGRMITPQALHLSFRTSASLRRTLRTVQTLKELLGTTCVDDNCINNSAKKVYRGLSTYIDQLDGNLASVEIMQKRIAATIGLVSSLAIHVEII